MGTDAISSIQSLLSTDPNLQNIMKNAVDVEQIKLRKEAFERLASDLTHSVDDHLDITLNEEKKFLNLYKSYLDWSLILHRF